MNETTFQPEVGIDVATPPIALLHQQATRWEEETGGILKGVVTTDEGVRTTMVHSLFVEAPRLDGYRYRIVSVMHRVYPLYPAEVVYDAASDYEYEISRLDQILIDRILAHRAESADRLKVILQAIFESEEVRNIVASLRTQSEMPVAA